MWREWTRRTNTPHKNKYNMDIIKHLIPKNQTLIRGHNVINIGKERKKEKQNY
jgi:hypothetical protein